MSFKDEIFKILPEVRRPSRYLGNEKNAVRKDVGARSSRPGGRTPPLRVALCYPDTYEIGMSNIGLSILYHLLNDQSEIACERVYTPWPDMEAKLREKRLPLVSLESAIPIRDFDILGISLPYELTYTNILTVLDLAKVPIYSKDRRVPGTNYPLILGGGTGAFNPEPVADFFDAVVIGDGEEAILEVCDIVKKWKRRGGVLPPGRDDRAPTKIDLLTQLAQIPGLYVPSFFDVTYKGDGTIQEIKPLLKGYTGIRKRTVSDLDRAYYPMRPIVPHTRVVHDRLGVEVQRGCTRGCRFCQAGYVYRPERQRSPETVREIVRNQLAATGQEDVSLVSLSVGDYDCITPLLKDLMDEHGPKKVGIALPATRVEQLTGAMMEEIRRVRKTGFTIAPEAATERMRDVINKGNSEANLLKTVETVFSYGWDLMKFYFMIGLPTETDADVTAIGDLGQKTLSIGLRHNRRAEINLGVSPFVPKPFTPYQWFGQISLEECRRKLGLLRSRIRSRRLHLKPHLPEASHLEGIFARGDRRLSALIVAAWKKGCRFDQWEEGLKFNLWQGALAELGIDPTFYVERERKQDEVLPWDHLFVELKKGWLWEEYQASLQAAFIEDCSTGKCTQCGVCDFKEVRNRAYELPQYDGGGNLVKRKTTTEIHVHQQPAGESLESVRAGGSENEPEGRIERPGASSKGISPAGCSYHCTFSKTGPAAFLSHLEFVDALRRTVARAGLPVRFSQGFHPLPRISFGPAMSVGKEMLDQEFRIELESPVETSEILSLLNRELPEGVVINSVIAAEDPRPPSPPSPSQVLFPSP